MTHIFSNLTDMHAYRAITWVGHRDLFMTPTSAQDRFREHRRFQRIYIGCPTHTAWQAARVAGQASSSLSCRPHVTKCAVSGTGGDPQRRKQRTGRIAQEIFPGEGVIISQQRQDNILGGAFHVTNGNLTRLAKPAWQVTMALHSPTGTLWQPQAMEGQAGAAVVSIAAEKHPQV